MRDEISFRDATNLKFGFLVDLQDFFGGRGVIRLQDTNS